MNKYTKHARSVSELTMMRGVTDFTNAAQFNLYESGYCHLIVISKPRYIYELAKKNTYVEQMLNTFCYILEYEFKGLSGIDDETVDTLEVTDGISTMNIIGKVNKQSAAEITMTFTEKSGSIITNFIAYYLDGIKDPRTQAKTYHGLIASGQLASGFEYEVFNLLYMALDNTMLQLEKSYLLCNAWPSKAQLSIYENEKGAIDKKDIDIPWQCFIIDGEEVDKRALNVLAMINEGSSVQNAVNKNNSGSVNGEITLDGSTKKPGNVTLYKNGNTISSKNRITQLNSNEFEYYATRDNSHIDKYVKKSAGEIQTEFD